MGLDQYAYTRKSSRPKKTEVAGSLEGDEEIAYWRKHYYLQNWMEAVWKNRNWPWIIDEYGMSLFNCVDLELPWEDLDRLEIDILNRELSKTKKRSERDDEYREHDREHDLEFIRKARDAISNGYDVIYSSRW